MNQCNGKCVRQEVERFRPYNMSAQTETKTAKKVAVVPRKQAPTRLYVKGSFIGYVRAHRNQSCNKHLLAIDGVKCTADSAFYMGKRVAYIYRAKTAVKGSHYRVVWGRIARPHGSNGIVRAYFRTALPARAMGASVRVMLYPSRV